jgi:hypothetical protein
MRQRDWRRDLSDEFADSLDGDAGAESRDVDGAVTAEEMRQLLLQETVTRAKAAELTAFRHFEREGASDEEWRLLLMDTPPTIH